MNSRNDDDIICDMEGFTYTEIKMIRTLVQDRIENRFQYADRILKNWKDKGVGKLSDVEGLDRLHEKKSKAGSAQGDASAAGTNSSNRFNRFSQRGDIDFAELEKKIVKN